MASSSPQTPAASPSLALAPPRPPRVLHLQAPAPLAVSTSPSPRPPLASPSPNSISGPACLASSPQTPAASPSPHPPRLLHPSPRSPSSTPPRPVRRFEHRLRLPRSPFPSISLVSDRLPADLPDESATSSLPLHEGHRRGRRRGVRDREGGGALCRAVRMEAGTVENVVALYSAPGAGDDVDAEDAKWEGAADRRWRPSWL